MFVDVNADKNKIKQCKKDKIELFCLYDEVKNYFDKKRLREQARDNYRNLSEKDKNKKREYGRKRYHNMSKEKKKRLKEYQKNYHKAKKSQSNN